MTNTSHPNADFTPGPWKVHKSVHADTGLLIEQHGGDVVAECDPLDNMAANARLIAAAPELFDAVLFAVNEIEGILHDETAMLDSMTQEQLDEVFPMLRTALAKARGEVRHD